MNQQQRDILAHKHLRVMSRFEREFVPPIYKAVSAQLQLFISELKKYGIAHALGNMDTTVLNDKLYEPLKDLYVTIGHYFAGKAARELKAQEEKGFGFNLDWLAKILEYFNNLALSKIIVPITQETKKQIMEALEEGEKNGWGIDKIVRNIEGIPLWRARLIVRTESVSAMFFGNKVGEEESPFESTEMWISAKDHRTRHSHRLMDGKRIDTGQKFAVPRYRGNVQVGVDMMEGPGDPDAHISNLANCRCTKVRRLKKDSNGNFIRKRQLEFN